MPIVVVGVGYQWAWRMRSWDRFVLPCPFSRATLVASEPMPVPANLDRDQLEQYRRLVEETFHRVSEAAENWVRSGKWPGLANREPKTTTLAA
jgi:lysophospholipid acyltransferase (LPLAT)-like uncharacterized protein